MWQVGIKIEVLMRSVLGNMEFACSGLHWSNCGLGLG